jgi:hypothetical protein
MAGRKPKAPVIADPAPTAPKPEAVSPETLKAKAKPKGKPKAPAKPAPVVIEKPVAMPKAPVLEPEPNATLDPPQNPEDAKIQQYFQNPKSKVSGKFRAKVLEWIILYETIGSGNDVWKKPNPITVWESSKHEFHEAWTQYMQGMTISDAEALICVALDNRVTALEQMLASWIAVKLRSVVGQPDLMVKMLEGNA